MLWTLSVILFSAKPWEWKRMRFLWKYLKKYAWRIVGVMGVKLSGTALELLIPYVMEHLIDHVVPTKQLLSVLLWGLAMVALAVCVRFLNVTANRMSVKTAKETAIVNTMAVKAVHQAQTEFVQIIKIICRLRIPVSHRI